jgi:Acetyl-CoA carboxylase, carboxyltransferase component (subunits alpha and beta)
VPLMSVVLRKAYGLGFYIMGSQALRPAVLLAWPGAQYGGMGLEGAVEIAHGREIASQPTPRPGPNCAPATWPACSTKARRSRPRRGFSMTT